MSEDWVAALMARFSAEQQEVVRQVQQAVAELGMALYVVGGIVRDLLLERPFGDLDFVVEGDGVGLAQAIQRAFGGTVEAHPQFGTAKWQPLTAVPPIDLITARREGYPYPAALPLVVPATIEDDLARRDFSVNAMALRLDGRGELLDPHGGREDLARGVIRVLHERSFVDDPTRIWRAVRYGVRLGFALEEETAELLLQAIPYLQRLSADRVRHELDHVLREGERTAMLAALNRHGVLEQIEPALGWNTRAAAAFERVGRLAQEAVWRPVARPNGLHVVYLALWLLLTCPERLEVVLERLRVSRRTRDDVLALRGLVAQVEGAGWGEESRPSAVAGLLRPFARRPHVLLGGVAYFGGESVEGALIAHFQRAWRLVRTAVTGDTLREMGLQPGPQFGQILDRLLAARLDGEIDEAGELELARRLVAEVS